MASVASPSVVVVRSPRHARLRPDPGAAASGRSRRPRPAEDVPRLRAGRRQVVPSVRRGAPPARARRGRRRRRRGSGAQRGAAGRRPASSRPCPCWRPPDVRAVAVRRRAGPASGRLPGRRSRPRQPARRARARSATRTSRRCIDAGISVLTSINLEYIAEQQAFIEQLFGPPQRRDRAAGLHRPRRRGRRRGRAGRSVAARRDAGSDAQALALAALRERALLLTADVVRAAARRLPSAQSRRRRPGARRSVSSSA